MITDFTTQERWTLPPLILHPFSDADGARALAQSSRASLIMDGLMSSEETDADDLERALLRGRLSEIRMLYYVGKDVQRWIDQCVDFASRHDELSKRELGFGSFARLLIEDPPEGVKAKLARWGVADYQAIFSRGLAIRTLLNDAPTETTLAPDFMRHYFRYADQIYSCRSSMETSPRITADVFSFELYASGEYSRLLERQWA